MQQDQKGCKKNNIRAEEEQITAARKKQHVHEKIPAYGRNKKKTTVVLKNVMQASEMLQEEQHTC